MAYEPSRWSAAALLAVLVCAVPASLASQGRPGDSAELRALFEADQADRRFTSPPTPEEWDEISERDAARRARVRDLLRADSVRTVADLYHAAMILQHGESSEDILLAHILSTAAGFRGHERARWLSAASLDRYLHRTERPQRLGTQYVRVHPEAPYRLDPTAPWSQGAYERWLPDSIRELFGVPPLSEQEASVERMNDAPTGDAAPSGVPGEG